MSPNSAHQKIKERLNQVRSQLPYLPRVLNWVWQSAPGETAAWAVLLILQALLPVVSVFLTRALVNAVVAVSAAGADSSWDTLVPLAAAQGGILILTGILSSLQTWITANQREKVQLYLTTRVYETTTELDLAYFESSHYFDQLRRATHDARSAPLELFSNLGGMVQNSITLIGMGGILFSYGWWLPFMLLLGGIPPAVSSILNNQRSNRWRKANTQNERRLFYYDWLLTMRHYAAEVRIFQMAKRTIEQYRQLQKRLSGEKLGLQKRELWSAQLASWMSLLVLGGIGVWAVLGNLAGTILIGDLALFWQVAQKGRTNFSSVLTSLSSIYRNMLYLQDMCELLDQKPDIVETHQPKSIDLPVKTGLQIENMCFQYPGHDQSIIKGMNLELKPKTITALVGVNGAGKSTLIKLLCRFYDPVEGVLKLNGVDVREYALLDYQQQISVLMQFPSQFYTSVEKNIAVNGKFDQNRLIESAQAAGADEFIGKLPNGYETMLGSMFDGTDLSGGEWLRIALARSFYRDCSIFLLDEPTEGMDSWAEMAWFQQFRKVAEDKISLIITHRFTTAMQADVIHLIDGGKIIESGSHDELVSFNGRYAESWKKQMRLTR